MKQKLGYFAILLCCCGLCSAQQVVSSGAYVADSEITFSWIIGGNFSHISTLGVDYNNPIQPFESPMSLKVYPNPAVDLLYVEITPSDSGQIVLELYNSTGVKMLNEKLFLQPVIHLNISDLPPGAYLLNAFSPSNEMFFRTKKVFK